MPVADRAHAAIFYWIKIPKIKKTNPANLSDKRIERRATNGAMTLAIWEIGFRLYHTIGFYLPHAIRQSCVPNTVG